jgi:hypothetical protein
VHVTKKFKVKRIHNGTLSIFRYSLKWKGKWSEFHSIQLIHFSAFILQLSFCSCCSDLRLNLSLGISLLLVVTSYIGFSQYDVYWLIVGYLVIFERI